MGQQVMTTKETPAPAGPVSGNEAHLLINNQLEEEYPQEVSPTKRKRRPPTPIRKPTHDQMMEDLNIMNEEKEQEDDQSQISKQSARGNSRNTLRMPDNL